MTKALFRDDMSAEAMFRARVASHLAPLGWVTRANAIKVCGDAAVKLRCPCGEACLVPYRCGSRSCPTCARIIGARKTAQVANRVAVALESRQIEDLWDGKGNARQKGWKLFTGTSRAGVVGVRFEPDVLVERIRRVRGAWGPFWRSTPWGARVRVSVEWTTAAGVVIRYSKRARRDTGGVMGVEVAPGGMVHLHAAIYGEFVETRALEALWSTALGEPAFVKVRAMRTATADDFAKALREVLKYVTKWDKAPGARELRAAAIECAMRGVRRIEMFGFLRGMKYADALVVREDAEACGSCGASDWSWSRIWTPDEVKANGGFGKVIAPLDDAERRKWRADPGKNLREHMRDVNADIVNEIIASRDAADNATDSRRDDTEEGDD